MVSIRQQKDESKHEMINMLTHQIGTIFNPLIQNTNHSYQLLANKMGRIANFFSAPQAQTGPIPQIVPARQRGIHDNGVTLFNQGQ